MIVFGRFSCGDLGFRAGFSRQFFLPTMSHVHCHSHAIVVRKLFLTCSIRWSYAFEWYELMANWGNVYVGGELSSSVAICYLIILTWIVQDSKPHTFPAEPTHVKPLSFLLMQNNHCLLCHSKSVVKPAGSRAKNSTRKMSSEWAESSPYKGVAAVCYQNSCGRLFEKHACKVHGLKMAYIVNRWTLKS